MKKVLSLVFSVASIVVLISISACSDDPVIKPKVSFAVSSMTVNEADGTIDVEVVLDRPAPEDFTIDYEISHLSTAQDLETESDETPAADFEIIEDINNYGEIDIAKGETSGVIQILIYSDFEFEGSEVIAIKLKDADSEKIEITREDDIEITIDQEDGLIVLLNWDSPGVDLDLLVRYGTNTSNWLGVVTGSLFRQPELAFIPNAMDDGAFGMSYTYYSGEVEPLDFYVDFIEVKNGTVEAEASWTSFSAQYTLANINEWESVSSTQVVQTFTKNGSVYSNFSDITVPLSGSRIEFQKIPSDPIKIGNILKSRVLKH